MVHVVISRFDTNKIENGPFHQNVLSFLFLLSIFVLEIQIKIREYVANLSQSKMIELWNNPFQIPAVNINSSTPKEPNYSL